MSYILRGENLLIVWRFVADCGTFKPYNFGIAKDITNLKQRLKLFTFRNIRARYRPSGPQCSGCLELCTFAASWKLQNCQNRDILPQSGSLHPNFTEFSRKLAICVTRNSIKCGELWSTFLKSEVM